jgi:hypothetical protein
VLIRNVRCWLGVGFVPLIRSMASVGFCEQGEWNLGFSETQVVDFFLMGRVMLVFQGLHSSFSHTSSKL